jgi:urease accessory protein
MSVATLRSEARVGVHGEGRVSFHCVDGVTRLKDLHARDPLRILLPQPAAGDVPLATLVTTSGGLVGGDEIDIWASVEKDARALVLPQAAEKVYRSTGAESRVGVALAAAPGGWLEWLPQETILFEGARLDRLTRIDVAPGAAVLAGEILVFGRRARGEKMATGLARDAWEVWVDGRLQWADALHLEGDIAATLAHPACFDGAQAVATAVHAADDAGSLIDCARDLLADEDGLLAAASVINGVLVVRWLGRDAQTLRRAFGIFWGGFREAVQGLPKGLPRLWEI